MRGDKLDIKKLIGDKKSIVYIAAVFVLGLFLLTGGSKTSVRNTETDSGQKDMSRRLEKILSAVEGAGNVRVLISYSRTGEKVLAYDSESENRIEDGRDETNVRNQVVYDGDSSPFVLEEYMPEPEGVIIVAQGGDNENVKKQLINGTVALLGIDRHKIEVLKMK